MRWLMVEDALRDRAGHWFEYVRTLAEGLRELGDEVVILADRNAEPFIVEALGAAPVLPDSIWHRMSDGAGAATRYLRVPVHAVKTWFALGKFLDRDPAWDFIFVPTVLVHHLLGWYLLIRLALRGSPARVLLFFPNLPIRLEPDGSPRWNASPTTRLMRLLLAGLRGDILSGRVILGVETEEMQRAFEQLTGGPVRYLPHPVSPLPETPEPAAPGEIVMACYGPGRPEKGSDVLQEAMVRHLERFPDGAVRFVFQWLQDFRNDRGERVELSPVLSRHPRVDVIRRYFAEGEYARHLLQTQVMLLPYRRSSYGLRVSRVLIEAIVNGIPVVVTTGTTLSSQAAQFGAAEGCADGSAESLVAAIESARENYPALRARALEEVPRARAHFSVRHFRTLLLGGD
jgi:glycosyltransferase involved in cell wall biosynthesis